MTQTLTKRSPNLDQNPVHEDRDRVKNGLCALDLAAFGRTVVLLQGLGKRVQDFASLVVTSVVLQSKHAMMLACTTN